MTETMDTMMQSPGLVTWLTLGVAVLFCLVVLVVMLRAQRNVATAALAVITLVSLSIAVTLAMRGIGKNTGGGDAASAKSAVTQPGGAAVVSLPALACVDDLAGDIVLAACERVLFGSADSVAAAVSYAASRLDQLTAHGAVTTADKTPRDQITLRHSIERDRYGLMSYVLLARDQCEPAACAAFASLSDRSKIVANMDERVYAGLIARYAPTWNTPAAAAVPMAGMLSGLPPSVPTGKPTTADFPTANSIPPITIMTPEPPLAAARPPVAAKKQAAPKAAARSPAAPVQLAPPAARTDN
jgi:hypothetical protein